MKKDDNAKMSRKRFLALLLGAAGASVAGGLWYRDARLRTSVEKLREGLAEEEFLEVFAGVERQVALLGERAAEGPFAGMGREELVAGLNEDLAAGEGSERGFWSLAGRLRERVREEFREGRLVIVEGWMLTETEARLCALVYLS